MRFIGLTQDACSVKVLDEKDNVGLMDVNNVRQDDCWLLSVLLMKEYITSTFSDKPSVKRLFKVFRDIEPGMKAILFSGFWLQYDEEDGLVRWSTYQGVSKNDLYIISNLLMSYFPDNIYTGNDFNFCLDCKSMVFQNEKYKCSNKECGYSNFEFYIDPNMVHIMQLLENSFNISVLSINSGLVEDKRTKLLSGGYTSTNHKKINNSYIQFVSEEDYLSFNDIVFSESMNVGDDVSYFVEYGSFADILLDFDDKNLIVSNKKDPYSFICFIENVLRDTMITIEHDKTLDDFGYDEVLAAALKIANSNGERS